MSANVFSITHVSDPHFGTTTPVKVDALRSAISRLAPDVVALSGDLTQRARPHEFRVVRAFVDSLAPREVILVPGNHDLPLFNVIERFTSPYDRFRKILERPLSTRKRAGAIEILALNSTHPSRVTQGAFGPEETAALDGFAEESLFRLVMLHHPLDCPKYVDEVNTLKGARETVPNLERARVDLVIGGHIHDPWITRSDDRYPGGPRPFVIGVAGTCLSSRTRAKAPNSFHHIGIEIAEGTGSVKLRIGRYDLDAKSGEFRLLKTSTILREGRDAWSQPTSDLTKE